MGVGALSGEKLGRRAVFLDRDGVINAMHYDAEHGLVDSPAHPEQFVLMPRVGEAIRAINAAGLLAVVISNQPGIAKGKYTRELLARIDLTMETALAKEGARLDAVFYCLHHPSAVVEDYRKACDCRKPLPGLIQRAADELGIALSASYMVGDGIVDVQAARAAGCQSVLLGPEKCYVCRLIGDLNAHPDFLAADLFEAVQHITSNQASEGTVDIARPFE